MQLTLAPEHCEPWLELLLKLSNYIIIVQSGHESLSHSIAVDYASHIDIGKGWVTVISRRHYRESCEGTSNKRVALFLFFKSANQ